MQEAYILRMAFARGRSVVFLLVLAIIACGVTACDSRRRINSDALPFSAANVSLGMPKDGAAKIVPMDGCVQTNEVWVSCTHHPTAELITFMGATVESVEVGLVPPYETIDRVKLQAYGVYIYDHQIESQWKLGGRCLNYFSAQGLSEFSPTASALMRSLLELQSYPSGMNDSICLSKEGKLIRVKNEDFGGKKTAWVEMYRPVPEVVRLFEEALALKEKSGQKVDLSQTQSSKLTKESATKTGPITCAAVTADSDDSRNAMEGLARMTGRPDGSFSRYDITMVGALCSGDTVSVDSLVDSGFIQADAAVKTAQALGKTYEKKDRSEQGLAYARSRKALASMGLCSVCADHIAQYVSKLPESDCGKLASQAFSGNTDAIQKLGEFPSYCEWKY